MARARDLNKQDNHVLAVIGDGALTGGMALEALDDAVRMKFNGISNMEEEIDIKSDWFEENDIER